jgi:hypothetical protein
MIIVLFLSILVVVIGSLLVEMYTFFTTHRLISDGTYVIKCPQISKELTTIRWTHIPHDISYDRAVISPRDDAGKLCMLLGLKYLQLTRKKNYCVARIFSYVSKYPENKVSISTNQPYLVIAKSDDVWIISNREKHIPRDMLFTKTKNKLPKLGIRGSKFIVVLLQRLNVRNY